MEQERFVYINTKGKFYLKVGKDGFIIAVPIEDNPCGKPHNNGEECLTIKEGI